MAGKFLFSLKKVFLGGGGGCDRIFFSEKVIQSRSFFGLRVRPSF